VKSSFSVIYFWKEGALCMMTNRKKSEEGVSPVKGEGLAHDAIMKGQEEPRVCDKVFRQILQTEFRLRGFVPMNELLPCDIRMEQGTQKELRKVRNGVRAEGTKALPRLKAG
jgi:hypothetical protein